MTTTESTAGTVDKGRVAESGYAQTERPVANDYSCGVCDDEGGGIYCRHDYEPGDRRPWGMAIDERGQAHFICADCVGRYFDYFELPPSEQPQWADAARTPIPTPESAIGPRDAYFQGLIDGAQLPRIIRVDYLPVEGK